MGTSARNGMNLPKDPRSRTRQTAPILVMMALFFMFGVMAVMNDILVPYVKKIFDLSRAESMLVQTSFFTAYFTGSLVYFLISMSWRDPIGRIGYKSSILMGLAIAALGSLLLLPAAELGLLACFLASLFVLGLGLAMLLIAANPYVAILGSAETASSRLNLVEGVNSLGTCLTPILGGYFVFKFFAQWGPPLLDEAGKEILTDTGETMTAAAVQYPYLIFAVVFVLLGVCIRFSHLPNLGSSAVMPKGAGAWRFRHLRLGMMAIFVYVGAEVAIGSLMINYLRELMGFPEIEAKSYLAFYWGGLMIGRFLGAYSLGKSGKSRMAPVVMTGISLLALAVIYGAVWMEQDFEFPIGRVLPFCGFMVLNLVAFRIGRSDPARTLLVFALAVVGLLTASMLLDGYAGMWAVLSVGLFNSIMWANIFTLAIKDLKEYTPQGSSLLIMSILGGAMIPLVQGMVADFLDGYHYSFVVLLICYIYLAFYGWKGHVVRAWRS